MRNVARSLALAAIAVAQISVARATMQASSTSGVGAIDIRHKNVGCVVAGLHPRFDACMFDPNQLGQARVFFRAASTKYWYFVTMAGARGANAGCLTGTLPKLRKDMVGQDIEIYIETMDKRLGVNQIPPYQARVVAKEGDCDPKKLIAPGVPKAPVVVGSTAGAPATPFGFVGGGISSTTIALGTLGFAGIGGGVYAATRGNDTPRSTPVQPPALPPPSPPTTVAVTPTPDTPTPPAPEPESYKVISAAVSPDHGDFGIDLHVTWSATSSCSHIKLAMGGGAPFRFGLPVNGSLTLAEGDPGYPPSPGSYHYRAICSADSSVERYTNVFTLDSPSTPTPVTPTPVTPTPDTPTPDTPTPDTPTPDQKTPPPGRNAGALGNTSTLQTTLDIPAGEGFVLVNGGQTAYPRQGQTYLALSGIKGANRVEAQILRAGRGGLWTFDLSMAKGVAPGSLRVLLGDVVRITPTSVTFRMNGAPGERVAFTFAGK
jgi:hypothetical protein